MSQRFQLDEDQDATIRETYKRIHADIKRENRDFMSLITVCVILGLCGMGAIALCTSVTSISPAGFVIGAIFVAFVAFMMLAH